MKIDGYSYEILKSISPQKVRLYLTSSGWQLERRDPTSDVFSNPVTGEVVDVPDDKEFRDYAYRLEEIIRTISDSENKSVQRIVAGMTIAASSDTIEYRYEHKNNEIGLIPVNDMIKIIDSGNNLNNFAYRDFCDYKPAYPNSNWAGRKILDDIRLGPTLPGSYVVQFIYPLMDRDDETYGSTLNGEVVLKNVGLRDVCDKVETSLAAVVEAAECGKKEIDSEFKISYNFVSSVKGFEFSNADMEFRRIRMINKKDEVRKPVLLTSRIFKRISDIEQNMRPDEMFEEQDFVGRIVEMKDPRVEKGDGPADVRIRFIDVDGKAKTAHLTLSGEELDNAYDASKERKNVSVSGKLVGAGRSRRIEDSTGFKIID